MNDERMDGEGAIRGDSGGINDGNLQHPQHQQQEQQHQQQHEASDEKMLGAVDIDNQVIDLNDWDFSEGGVIRKL